jgi:hypothetical protein
VVAPPQHKCCDDIVGEYLKKTYAISFFLSACHTAPASWAQLGIARRSVVRTVLSARQVGSRRSACGALDAACAWAAGAYRRLPPPQVLRYAGINRKALAHINNRKNRCSRIIYSRYESEDVNVVRKYRQHKTYVPGIALQHNAENHDIKKAQNTLAARAGSARRMKKERKHAALFASAPPVCSRLLNSACAHLRYAGKSFVFDAGA